MVVKMLKGIRRVMKMLKGLRKASGWVFDSVLSTFAVEGQTSLSLKAPLGGMAPEKAPKLLPRIYWWVF